VVIKVVKVDQQMVTVDVVVVEEEVSAQCAFFVNSALKMVSKIHKYTPTDCFFGDFTHWVGR